jgi:uncharacterized membrane protein
LSQQIADRVTAFSGSMTFVVIHLVWFAAWILANLLGPRRFDPFPFGLLTLVVSLEAIFLSTFVLISQNRQSARSDERAKQDFETDLYSEALTKVIGEHLGISRERVRQRYRQLLSEAHSEDDDAAS